MAQPYQPSEYGSSESAESSDSAIVIPEGNDSLPLLKYQNEAFEIKPQEFTIPKPFYVENNYNFFHPNYTASSLVIDHYHQEHHFQHSNLPPKPSINANTDEEEEEDEEDQDEITEKRLKKLTDILNSFLYPRDIKDKKGRCYRQNVSTAPARPAEVKMLAAEVERRLAERYARDTGYCPIRREIFSDCFDELLRQVIVEDPVAGVLLGRIRDELKMTLSCIVNVVNSFRRLNESMEAYGLKKSIVVEATMSQLNTLTTNVDQDQTRVYKELIALRAKHAQTVADLKKMEVQLVKDFAADARGRHEELAFFKEISHQLNKKLEEVRANAKEYL